MRICNTRPESLPSRLLSTRRHPNSHRAMTAVTTAKMATSPTAATAIRASYTNSSARLDKENNAAKNEATTVSERI
jgi:hypothetical protein